MSTNKPTPHPHAESMLLYAQDATETEKPWERWECKEAGTGWYNLTYHPVWNYFVNYRRKPCTILIKGIEVPEPVKRELLEGQSYYVVDITCHKFMQIQYWNNDPLDTRFLERGLIHLSEENAKKHAEALLSFTRK